MKKIFVVLLIIPLFFGCEKEDDSSISKGYIVFNNQINSIAPKSTSNDFDSVKYAVLTITDAEGTVIKDSEKIELYKFEGAILSFPIELNVGTYYLTDFYLVDANNNVLFAAPKEGSKLAAYVLDPLKISFEILSNNETKKTVEVLSTEGGSAQDFGYSEFDAILVKTFDIVVSAFEYNSSENLFELTDGILEIHSNNFSFIDTLLAINNIVKIKDGLDTYQIIFRKDENTVYDKTFTLSELKSYGTEYLNPLKIYVGSTDITLQPGSEGKDAFVHGLDSEVNKNYGDNPQLAALAWTFNGSSGIVRGLIDFDFSSIPSDATIISAKLSLYAWNSETGFGLHSNLSGSNSFTIQKVTSAWDENTVTWNNQPSTTSTNEVILEQSESGDQDYLNIDITNLVQNMVDDPSNKNGLMIKLLDENYYRRINFCSSDYSDSTRRPKLMIKYIN